MKRYIRTKDGKIKDLKVLRYAFEKSYFPNQKDYEDLLQSPIIKTADTIEELIKVGDLVKFGGTGSHTFVSVLRDKTSFYDYWGCIKEYQYITELYTKQGNDYILVAKKENGEWRVI